MALGRCYELCSHYSWTFIFRRRPGAAVEPAPARVGAEVTHAEQLRGLILASPLRLFLFPFTSTRQSEVPGMRCESLSLPSSGLSAGINVQKRVNPPPLKTISPKICLLPCPCDSCHPPGFPRLSHTVLTWGQDTCVIWRAGG